MTDLLAELLRMSRTTLIVGFVVLLRVGGMVALAPGFGEQALPARIKLVVSVAITLLCMPAMHATLVPLIVRSGPPFWMMFEIATGVFLGMGLRLFIIALQVAGMIAAQATSLSQLLGGTAGEPQPAIGNLMVMAGIAILMQMGFPLYLVEFVLESYQALPAGALPDAGALHDWGLAGVSRAFSLAFMIAAPFVITGLIYNAALGAINRAMPQLMVAFVGAPALTAGGLILLAIALPGGIIVWREGMANFLTHPFGGAP